MTDANLAVGKIRNELKKGLPSKKKIFSYLLDLLKRQKYPSLSDSVKKRIKKLYSDERILE